MSENQKAPNLLLDPWITSLALLSGCDVKTATEMIAVACSELGGPREGYAFVMLGPLCRVVAVKP